jgi:hypothetical protein
MAAKGGSIACYFDSLVSRLDCIATRVNDRAEAAGLKVVDDTPIEVTFGGDASAYGEDTYANGIMLGTAVDLGHVSYAIGTCSFTAIANASGDDTAIAIADSFASVTGADLVLTFTQSGSTPLVQGADVSKAFSSTSFLAIDLDFWDSARGPIVVDYDIERGCLRLPSDIEGNTAVMDALLEVLGNDSFVSLETDTLSIENTLSTVSAVGTLIAG